MDITKAFKFNQGQVWNTELQLALAILLAITLLVILAIFYLRYTQKKQRYKLFLHEMSPRGFEEWEIKRIFNYLHKHDIDSKLFLESEKVATEVIHACSLDKERSLKRLGFDTEDLIKRFLQKQQELRKKWNR